MPNAHIYALSRLVHAGPVAWQRLLTEIEDGSSYASRYYLPMREVVVRFCASHGRDADGVVREMRTQIRDGGGARWANRLRDNVRAFESFRTDFFPRITRFRRSLLHERKDACGFEGVDLNGAPHLEVVDHEGRTRHVFLYAAKWSDKDLAAYLELLGIIVEEDFGGDTTSLWVMDLRGGKDVRWRSSARMRRRCVETARLYARFVNAMGDGQEPGL
jgi:hypothetical protein